MPVTDNSANNEAAATEGQVSPQTTRQSQEASNDLEAVNPPQPQPGEFGGPPEGVRLRQPGPTTNMPAPKGDIDSFLYGPSDRPQEPVTRMPNRAFIPDYLYTALPALIRAADDPDASPALLRLVRLLSYRMGG